MDEEAQGEEEVASPHIKAARGTSRREYRLTPGGTLELLSSIGGEIAYSIAPSRNAAGDGQITVYKHFQEGAKQEVMELSITMAYNIIRCMPAIITAARRMAVRHRAVRRSEP